MADIYNGKAPKTVYADEVLRQIGVYCRNRAPISKEDMVGEYFTWTAAWYLITGRALTADSDVPVDYNALKDVAEQLKAAGAVEYARKAYLNQYPVLPQNLDPMGFLMAVQGGIQMDEEKLLNMGVRANITNEMLEKRARGDLSCVEYQTFAAMDAASDPQPANRRYRQDDRSVYEYVAPEGIWRPFTALAACIEGTGYQKLDNEMVENMKNSSFAALTMKNKRTVEKMQYRDYDAVREAYRKTRNSFTFANQQQFARQKVHAQNCLHRLAAMEGDYTGESSWNQLLDAVEGFTKAKTPEQAAEKSADVLQAVEAFSKGRKSKFASHEEQEAVNEALLALAITVPDASNNPSVQPLLNRFNTVRKVRLQGEVRLQDYGTSSRLQANPDIEHIQRPIPQAQTAATGVQNELYRLHRQRNLDDMGVREAQPEAAQNQPQPKVGQNQPQPKDVQNQPQPKEDYMPSVPLNLQAPEEMDPAKYGEVEENPELNDAERFLYEDGPLPENEQVPIPEPPKEQAPVDPEQEKPVQKISVEQACLKTKGFLLGLKYDSVEKLAQLNSEMALRIQFAQIQTLNEVKPLEGDPKHLDELEMDSRAEALRNDPVIIEMSQQFLKSTAMRRKFKEAYLVAEKKGKNTEKSFAELFNGFYQEVKKALQKKDEKGDREEDEKEVPEDEKKVQEDENDRESVESASSIGDNQDRFTQVSM